MRMFNFSGRHRRSLLIMVSFSLVALFVTSTLYLQENAQTTFSDMVVFQQLEHDKKMTFQLSSHISDKFIILQNELEFLSTDSLVNQGICGEQANSVMKSTFKKLTTHTNIDSLSILDANGTVCNRISPTSETDMLGTDFSDSEIFLKTKELQKPYFSDAFVGFDNRHHIMMTYPIIHNETGNFMGSVNIVLPSMSFFDTFHNVFDEGESLIMIVDKNYNFVTHPNINFVGKNVFDTEFQQSIEYDNNMNIFFNQVFSNYDSSVIIHDDNSSKLITGIPVVFDREAQYYMLFSSPTTYTLSIFNSVIGEQNQYLITLMVVLILVVVGNLVIFEKYKTREESENYRKLALIGEISSRMAHDIKNPLSVIKNSIEILRLDDNPKLAKNLTRMDTAVQRINHQVEDVLGFIRLQPLHKFPTSLFEIIHNTKNDMIIPNSVKIDIVGKDAKVNCDSVQLQSVFNNLFLNAIQAMQNAGKITVKVAPGLHNVIIDFVDSGPGVPKENVKLIFDPLFTTKQEGTGLGLVSVKKIIEGHDGTMTFKNNPTTFTITLPIVEKEEEQITYSKNLAKKTQK